MLRTAAITLIELLVILVIVAMLVALLLPALISGRETARRTSCEAGVKKLILAVQNYQSTTQVYPSGVMNPSGPIANDPNGMHHSWIVQLLPFLDEQVKFDQIDPTVSIYAERHAKVRQSVVPVLICTSAPTDHVGSSYAACHSDVETPIDSNNTGTFFLNSEITPNEVDDGLSYTLFLGEKRNSRSGDLGWLSGTRATLRNTGTAPNQTPETGVALGYRSEAKFYAGGFGSWHVGHTHLTMGDATVKFTSDAIDLKVYQQIGNRSDGASIAKSEGKPNP